MAEVAVCEVQFDDLESCLDGSSCCVGERLRDAADLSGGQFMWDGAGAGESFCGGTDGHPAAFFFGDVASTGRVERAMV